MEGARILPTKGYRSASDSRLATLAMPGRVGRPHKSRWVGVLVLPCRAPARQPSPRCRPSRTTSFVILSAASPRLADATCVHALARQAPRRLQPGGSRHAPGMLQAQRGLDLDARPSSRPGRADVTPPRAIKSDPPRGPRNFRLRAMSYAGTMDNNGLGCCRASRGNNGPTRRGASKPPTATRRPRSPPSSSPRDSAVPRWRCDSGRGATRRHAATRQNRRPNDTLAAIHSLFIRNVGSTHRDKRQAGWLRGCRCCCCCCWLRWSRE